MIGGDVRRKGMRHLQLAEGFMKTAEVRDDSNECEIRNAFSRTYYALFHACCAHLLSLGASDAKVESISKDHGRLHSTMREPMGKPFERYLRDAYERRRQSDYKPEWAVPAPSAVREELKQARTQFYWLLYTTRRSLGTGRDV
jgi:uncharacterized protein (UPF0332 family)